MDGLTPSQIQADDHPPAPKVAIMIGDTSLGATYLAPGMSVKAIDAESGEPLPLEVLVRDGKLVTSAMFGGND